MNLTRIMGTHSFVPRIARRGSNWTRVREYVRQEGTHSSKIYLVLIDILAAREQLLLMQILCF